IRHHLGKSELLYLEKYGTDLTKLVKEGKLKPVVGRNEEIIQCLKVLSKMETNNPLLVGAAGVGKTAVVEGLAQMLAAGNGPKRFINKRVISLNLNSLVSETKYRGEFEQRLEEILDEVRSNADRLIIFIDEIHTLLNLGATEGAAGAGNILKPVLARGEFPCIGATTPEEFDQFIATDQALCRRFQLVTVDEPSAKQTLDILRGIKGVFEEHHQVVISDKSLIICVELAERNLLEQSFPGKAIKMLDSACAAAAFESLDEVKPNFIKHEFERMRGY
ncbi:MAG: ATP-dependent Clp protease ATP-binding subunit, partial [Bdellovibrionales bacterium]|nr:ATP-dependent Clp protease ATP-binding subunit [Bdellovibrionales bacterium]